MARPDSWVSFGPLRGQNSTENPLALPPGTATATNNIVLDPESCVAVKRKGSSSLTVPAVTILLARHKPNGSNEAEAELWAFWFNGVFGASRKVGAAAFASVGSFPTDFHPLRTITLNGKLFMVGLTNTVNRMYVWDGTSVRKVGLARSAAPTVADIGAGSYAATLQYYKVSWKIKSGTTVVAASELSASVSITPSGTGAGVRVTKPTTLDSATHWIVWGSPDDVTYHNLSGDIDVATTVYDNVVQPSVSTGDQPAEVGTYLPPPSPTRIITDGNRLLMAGLGGPTTASLGETTPKSNRVWFTPVLGSSDQGDDERIPVTSTQRNFLDLGENTNDGEISELVGPINGVIFVFTQRRIWKLAPTGDVTTPYVTYPVSDRYGARGIQDKTGLSSSPHITSAAPGEDESGATVAYFLSDAGVYRVGQYGVQYVSFEIQSELSATNPLNAFLLSYPQKKQLWVCVRDSSNVAVAFIFHWQMGRADADGDVRGGWTTWTTPENLYWFEGCLHNTTPGTAGFAPETLIPYFVTNTGLGRVFERNAATDGSTNYAASVTYAPILPTGGQTQVRLGPPTVIATTASGVSLRFSAIRDFGTETRTADVSLTAAGSETRVVRTVEGLYSADATAIQLAIGDASANENLWRVDWMTAPIARQETR